jgi:hypothetical protein
VSVKNRSDLVNEIVAQITANGIGAITGPIVQAILQDLADSGVNMLGDTAIQGKLGYSTLVTINSNGDITHKKYVDDSIVAALVNVLLADGSVQMTGNLQLGSNNITGINALVLDNNGRVGNLAATAYIDFGTAGILAITGTTRFPSLTVSTVPYLNGTGDLTSSSVTPTELGYLSGVSSEIQTQLNSKAEDSVVVHNTGTESIAGVKTFSSSPIVPTPTTSTQASNKSYTDGAAFINAIIFG